MSESCKWGYDECLTPRENCIFCSTDGLRYHEPKRRYRMKKNTQKADKRMGSSFEFANHENNKEVLETRMTLNSGATAKEKGDEQIRGSIRVMEELKTQMPDRAKGCKSFAIKRKWLDKLHREALAENMEFWYLKFAFNEDEGAAIDHEARSVFVVTEEDMIMSMVRTMAIDREKANLCDKKIDFYKKKSMRSEAENVALKARIEELESQVELLKAEKKS